MTIDILLAKYTDKLERNLYQYGSDAFDLHYTLDVVGLKQEYWDNPNAFELVEPALMAFAMVAGDNLKMSMSNLDLIRREKDR